MKHQKERSAPFRHLVPRKNRFRHSAAWAMSWSSLGEHPKGHWFKFAPAAT